MYFDSLSALLHMDGHGPYVWIAYATGAVLILGNLAWALRRGRNVRRDIQRQLERQAQRGDT